MKDRLMGACPTGRGGRVKLLRYLDVDRGLFDIRDSFLGLGWEGDIPESSWIWIPSDTYYICTTSLISAKYLPGDEENNSLYRTPNQTTSFAEVIGESVDRSTFAVAAAIMCQVDAETLARVSCSPKTIPEVCSLCEEPWLSSHLQVQRTPMWVHTGPIISYEYRDYKYNLGMTSSSCTT
ncbi:hypothetical protein BJ165DRAFT_1454132 [Panaeolus papilionaceus]|nr:hypothetical protein BJ165DRAFT_1454132 [Panaeolus papilionaceus]